MVEGKGLNSFINEGLELILIFCGKIRYKVKIKISFWLHLRPNYLVLVESFRSYFHSFGKITEVKRFCIYV